MEVEELLRVDGDEGGVLERDELLEGAEVDVVGGVYGLRDSEDGVCDGDAAAEDGGVFDVVDTMVRLVWVWDLGRRGDAQ